MFEIAGAARDLLKRASFQAYWLLRTLFRWLSAGVSPRPGEGGPDPARGGFARALDLRAIQHVRIAGEDVGLSDPDTEIYLVSRPRKLVVVVAPSLVAKYSEESDEIFLSAWIDRFLDARTRIASRLGLSETDVGLVVVGSGGWLEAATTAHVMIVSRAGFFDMFPPDPAEIEDFGAASANRSVSR